MISIEIHNPSVEHRLQHVSRAQGIALPLLVEAVMQEYLDDMEDIAMAEAAMMEPEREISQDELERRLGFKH